MGSYDFGFLYMVQDDRHSLIERRVFYMKKLMYLTLAVVLCLSMTVTAMADNLGEITGMNDTVTPDGENGIITSVIAGVTDGDGVLALPAYKDATIVSAVATKGTLSSPPENASIGSTKYYLAQFAEKEAEVELTVIWQQEGTYKLGKAKMKDTAPGGVQAASYSMTNTSPIKIKSYKLDMAVPQGYEMFSIVDYDPEEDFDIYHKDGFKFGHYTFGELAAGGNAKLTINLTQSGAGFATATWAVAVLISAFFLYKNRDMLRQASELDAAKKSKQGA